MADEFKRGAVIALSTLNALHDQPTICSEVLGELGITPADCGDMDLTEYDLASVAQILAASRTSPKCTEKTDDL